MAQPFLALITPLGDTAMPPSPPGIWGPTDPRPSNPIAGPGRPPNWGMAGDPGYGVPLPPPPLVIWGPGDPRPTLPIAGPGRPPGWGIANDPGYGIPIGGLGTWGPNDPRPSNPIAEPPWGWGGTPPALPTLPPEVPSLPGKIDWDYAWTPSTGWIVIGIPQFPVPTPSAAKK